MGIGIDPKRADYSYIRRITPVNDRVAIVQVSTSTLASLMAREEWQRLDTYVVDPHTGKGLYVSDRLPLLTAVTTERVYGVQNNPYPRVTVFAVPR